MSIIPLDVQRRCERRWAARFSWSTESGAPRNQRPERESQQMGDEEKRSGSDRRATKERRSGTDTRSEEEKRLIGERRSQSDRRSGQDRRAERGNNSKD
jgi:hypothetical protein